MAQANRSSVNVDFFRINVQHFDVGQYDDRECFIDLPEGNILFPKLIEQKRYKLITCDGYNFNELKKKTRTPAFLRAMGTAKPGAMGKSMGSVAASAKLTILASGFAFKRSAAWLVARTQAAAPSLRVEAFPAVMVPFSFYRWLG